MIYLAIVRNVCYSEGSDAGLGNGSPAKDNNGNVKTQQNSDSQALRLFHIIINSSQNGPIRNPLSREPPPGHPGCW